MIIVIYLKNYSASTEEKVKSAHEKNPELPTEIRSPEECFTLIQS